MNFEVRIPDPNAGSPEFYMENGLKHCPLCHTPMETWVTFGATRKKVPCLCQCRTEARDQRDQAVKARQEAERQKIRKASHIHDPALRRMTFEADNGACPGAIEKAKRYVAQFEENLRENIGLLFYGDVGTGKTFTAGCIINALDDKGYNVLGTSLTRLRDDMPGEFDKDRSRNAYYDRLAGYDLVLIDDFGIERQSEYTLEQIYSLIDARYKSGKPTIITTNLTPEQLSHPQSMATRRIYDRITGMYCPMLFEGQSQRQAQHEEKMARAREMLSTAFKTFS